MIRNLLLRTMARWMLLSSAFAQVNSLPLQTPSGSQHMAYCSDIKDKTVVLGLKHSRMLSNGSCVNVLTMDLNLPGLQIAARGGNENEACQTVSKRAADTHAIAAVNGGFFCYQKPTLCASSYVKCPDSCAGFSLLKIDGELRSTNCSPIGKSVRRTALGWSNPSDPKIDRIPSGKDWKEVSSAMGAGPTLVKNGKVYVTKEGFGWEREPHPRTAAGLNQYHQMVIVTVDSPGWTLPVLAQFLVKQLNMKQAMNLDGGGSSTMVIQGEIVNQPSNGAERRVYDSLEIVATSATAEAKAEKP